MSHNNTEQFRAIRITASGDVERINLDRAHLLSALYAAIDCRYVEVVQPTEMICLWVDEEGIPHRAEPNYLATRIAAQLGFFPQVLRGTVVITGGADGEGNTLPLNQDDLDRLEGIVDRISGVGQKRGRTQP